MRWGGGQDREEEEGGGRLRGGEDLSNKPNRNSSPPRGAEREKRIPPTQGETSR